MTRKLRIVGTNDPQKLEACRKKLHKYTKWPSKVALKNNLPSPATDGSGVVLRDPVEDPLELWARPSVNHEEYFSV